MKKLLVFLTALGFLFCCAQTFAAPWAIVSTQPDPVPAIAPTTIHTIDMGVTPPKVYGPFLGGQIGSGGGGLFDVAMLPGQRFAIVSNFGDSKIFLIDLKNPTRPVVKASLRIPFFAEDMAISPDGSLALVADGGFSPRVAFVDLKTFTLRSSFNLNNKYVNAIEIAPNGTVLMADYFQAAVYYGTINGAGNGLSNVKTICLCDGTLLDEDNCSSCRVDDLPTANQGRPVNITVSPNGKTALVANANIGYINALEIKGPGEVVRGNPFFVKTLGGDWDNASTPDPEERGGCQSIQFQSDARAYALYQPTDPDAVDFIPNVLRGILITGPGQAEIADNATMAPITLVCAGTSQLFGVDTFGIAGGQALVGRGTLSEGNINFVAYVSYVNLVTGTMTPVYVNSKGEPTGVGIKLW